MKKLFVRTLFFSVAMLFVNRLFPSPNEFSIYLVKEKNTYSLSFLKKGLREIKLEEKPIITLDDIVSYYANTHEIKLTETAYERFSNIQGTNCKFVLCVGDERIYAGDIVSLLSSASFGGIVILKPFPSTEAPSPKDFKEYKGWEFWQAIYTRNKQRIIKLQLGYPDDKYFYLINKDCRSDPRVLNVFKRVGKLKTKIIFSNELGYGVKNSFSEIKPWLEYRETWELIFIALVILVLIFALIKKRNLKG